jgi:hypothetical protein
VILAPAERVTSVQQQVREMSAQLRVLSLHVQAGAASLETGGDAGAGFALQRADADLNRVLEQAPWITAERGNALRVRLHELQRAAGSGASTDSFAADVDRLADDLDGTFGLIRP